MDTMTSSGESPDRIAATLLRLSPDYAATPLLDLPRLAGRLGVAQVLAKDEGRRTLGSFKSLGGTYAGLRALARAAGTDIEGLLGRGGSRNPLPTLVTASAGNHGLAVAAAARFVGARARIYLYPGVAPARVRRIEAQGAEIVWVDGTYDDAVDQASGAARAGDGLLVADTSTDPSDPAVADIMAGYGVLSAEIRRQVDEAGGPRPTHLFVQAGVGGLAAAMTAGLKAWMAPPARIVVAEPAAAACVAAALTTGQPVRIPGNLATCAGMLACGEASAPALDLLRHGEVGDGEVREGEVREDEVRAMAVSETALTDAVTLLRDTGGPGTTPSGAAGLAGLAATVADPGLRLECGLDESSRVLIIVTETELEKET